MKTLNAYMDQAWDDLATDEGWWQAVFALGLMNCVPIIGQIMMFGYLFDWAKEAAWGMRTHLSRKLGDLGRCTKYGFLAFWILVLWLAPVIIAAILLGLIPVAGPIIQFLVNVFAVVVGAIAAVGALRSIIYERVMPGLQVKRILRMVRRDPGGLAHTFSVILLVIPLFAVALFIVLLPTIPFISIVANTTVIDFLGSDLVTLVVLGMITIVVMLVVWVGGAIVSAFICALYARSLGYWISQFDPPAWRSPDTLMPFEVEMAAEREAKRAAKAKSKKAKSEKQKQEDEQ